MTQTVKLNLYVATDEAFHQAGLETPEDDRAQVVLYDPAKDAFFAVDIAAEALLKDGMKAIAEAAENNKESLDTSFAEKMLDAVGSSVDRLKEHLDHAQKAPEIALPDGNNWSTQAQDSDAGDDAKLDAVLGTAGTGVALIVAGVAVTAAGAALGTYTGGATAVKGAAIGADLAKMGGVFLVVSFLVATDQIKAEDTKKEDLPQDGDPALGKIGVDYVDSGFGDKDPLDQSEVMLKENAESFEFIKVDIEAEEDTLDGLILQNPEDAQLVVYVADFSHLELGYGLIDPPIDEDGGDPPVLPETPTPEDPEAFLWG